MASGRARPGAHDPGRWHARVEARGQAPWTGPTAHGRFQTNRVASPELIVVNAPTLALHNQPHPPTMPPTVPFPIEGGCDCRAIRYRLMSAPLVVHCCHCRWCQRESGSSFALNAMIESDRVVSLGVSPERVHTPSDSGFGQQVARCPHCKLAVWSHYAGSGPVVSFVRVGTLDQPDLLPPDVHIFTASKQPWVVLPEGARAFAEYYDRDTVWPAPSLARRAALQPRIEAHQAQQQAAG